MKRIEHHRIYGDPRFNAAFPSVVRLSDDRLLLAFRRARDSRAFHGQKGIDLGSFVTHLDPRSHLALMDLDGHGRPIGEPRIAPICPEAADQDPNLLVLDDTRVLLASFAWNPICAGDLSLPGFGVRGPEGVGRLHAYWFALWGCNIRLSDDRGVTFSTPTYLPEGPKRSVGERGAFGGATRGRLAKQGNTIYWATYAAPNSDGLGRHPQIYVSEDAGRSFSWRASIVPHTQLDCRFAESALHLASSGRLWCFLRSSRKDDATVVCWSDDQGQTWSEPRVTELVGHPVDPVPLADGRVLLVYGYRHPPYGIRARLWDGQNTDLAGEELIVRDDGRSGDLGYPWGTQLADGSVLVTYYFHDKSGLRSIEASRIHLT